jgi:hypoxanthine phosphoribosyltransferase
VTEPFVEVIDEATLTGRVAQLGAEIAAALQDDEPVVVGILKGSVPFLRDLARWLPIRSEIEFLALTRFGHEGKVSIAMDASIPLADRSILLVEDIVDTGLTLSTLHRMLEARGAREVKTVALIDKVQRRIVDVPVDHAGFEVGDEYLLGYGMDWEGRYRNLRSIWAALDLNVLQEDPLAFARHLLPESAVPPGPTSAR